VAEHILRVTKGSNFHKQLSAEQGTANKVTLHDQRHDQRHDTLDDVVEVYPAHLVFLLSDLLLGNNPPNDYIEECISRQEPLVKV
jgi:pyridoxine 5'-phosphate synthase PdxJ